MQVSARERVRDGYEDDMAGRTLRLHALLHLLRNLERLARVYDIDDRAGSGGLKVFEEGSRVTTVRVRRVYALRGKVVQLLEVCIPIGQGGLAANGRRMGPQRPTSLSPSHKRT